jgi:hypothetical protein
VAAARPPHAEGRVVAGEEFQTGEADVRISFFFSFFFLIFLPCLFAGVVELRESHGINMREQAVVQFACGCRSQIVMFR